MKHLLTFFACLFTVSMSAQIEFPYNPDSNSDDVIGTVDLLELLSLFGEEFSAEGLYLNTDSTEAVFYTGEMYFAQCWKSCKDLPGNWQVSRAQDLWSIELQLLGTEGLAFIHGDIPGYQQNSSLDAHRAIYVGYGTGIDGGDYSYLNGEIDQLQTQNLGFCYCATHERPKVEYSYCSGGSPESLTSCIDEKLTEGWYPLSGWISDFTKQGYGNRWGGGSNSPVHEARIAPVAKSHAAFWRWAE
jgi:hypothetical protein